MNNLELLRWFVLSLLQAANDHSGSRVEFTFPGTHWCGPGNLSDGNGSLGIFRETDKCCLEHDHCPYYLSSNETKYGLTNDVPYTRSECRCDEAFYNCLRGVDSSATEKATAELMGHIYFTFLEDRCFERVTSYVLCDINSNPENCTIASAKNSSDFVWRTMPAFV